MAAHVCLSLTGNMQQPAKWPDCLLGKATQPSEGRVSETTDGNNVPWADSGDPNAGAARTYSEMTSYLPRNESSTCLLAGSTVQPCSLTP